MINITIEIITVLVEILTTVYYLNGLLSYPKIGKLISAFSFILFAASLSVMSVLPVDPLIRILFSACAIVGICIYLYKSDILKSIYISLIFCALAVGADLLCSAILELLGMPAILQLYSPDAEHVIYIVVAKLVHLIGIQVVITIERQRKKEGSLIQAIPLILGQIVSIFICYQLYIDILGNVSPTYIIAEIIGMLYINIIICFYVESVRVLYRNRQERELDQKQSAIQKTYYEQVLKSQEETRALWHDIKKYLNAINTLIQSGDHESSLESMRQVMETIEDIHKVVDVGNQIINGVLEYELNKAEGADVHLNVDAWVSETINISPIDLYVVLGNTIDNAIEECALLEKNRVVDIIIKQKNRMLYCEIRNPCTKKKRSKPGLFHGYGLKNVEKCVEKYNGSFSYGIENNVFVASIQLNI